MKARSQVCDNFWLVKAIWNWGKMLFIWPYMLFPFSRYLDFCFDILAMQKNGLIKKIRFTLFLKKKIFLLFIIFSGQTSMSGYLYFVRYLAICVWAFFYMTIKPRHKFKYPENNELLRWIHHITGLWFIQIILTMINKVVSKQDKVNLNANFEDTFLKIGIVFMPPFLMGRRRVEPLSKFSKKRGIDRISVYRRELLGKMGDDFFQVRGRVWAVFTWKIN